MADTLNVLDHLQANIYSLMNLKRDAGDDADVNKAIDNLAGLFLERAAKKLRESAKTTDDFPVEVADMFQSGYGKIALIKKWRELTGGGLTDGKVAVQKWADANGYWFDDYGARKQ